jgi:hypothetical protein
MLCGGRRLRDFGETEFGLRNYVLLALSVTETLFRQYAVFARTVM